MKMTKSFLSKYHGPKTIDYIREQKKKGNLKKLADYLLIVHGVKPNGNQGNFKQNLKRIRVGDDT